MAEKAIKASVKLQGAQEMRRRLNRLGEKTARKAERAGIRAAGAGILTAARRRVPRRLGDLRESLLAKWGLKVYFHQAAGMYIGVVGPGKLPGGRTGPDGRVNDPRKYAHLVEFGTDPHVIQPKNKKALAFGRGAGEAGAQNIDREVVAIVDHPGNRPTPFLRPAYDEERGKVTARMWRACWRVIQREARKR